MKHWFMRQTPHCTMRYLDFLFERLIIQKNKSEDVECLKFTLPCFILAKHVKMRSRSSYPKLSRVDLQRSMSITMTAQLSNLIRNNVKFSKAIIIIQCVFLSCLYPNLRYVYDGCCCYHMNNKKLHSYQPLHQLIFLSTGKV